MLEVREFQGVPVSILETWIDATMHLRRSINASVEEAIDGARTGGGGEVRRVNHEYVLQGRMEGAALVWHRMSGERDESDAELAGAAVEYAKTYRPGFQPIRT